MASRLATQWEPGARPGWVRALNRIGDPSWLVLDADGIVAEATGRTGLSDFGSDSWREGYAVFVDALESEAQLNLIGRVLARADLLNWLENRLRIADHVKRHPEVATDRIERPLFITGLPRTGTSIVHELLGQDRRARTPLAWEVRYPCPPPEAANYATDPRIDRADEEVRFWSQVVPEYDALHELGARLPVECIQITAHEFRSDELSGRHGVPSYAGWLASADLTPAYAFHKQMLQLLQSRAPAERWVLKAPSHLGSLDALLAVYPDARIIWTHRDPLTVMASVASMLFSTAWVRSDAVDIGQLLTWFSGETCLALLDRADAVRSAVSDPDQFCDVQYADFMRDPIATLSGVYEHFSLDFAADTESRMRSYLDAKPKGRHGRHRYEFENTGFDPRAERERFAAYQQRYRVASER